MYKKFTFAFLAAMLAIGLAGCGDDVTGPSTEFTLSRLSASYPLGDGASISLTQLDRNPQWDPLGFDVELVTLHKKRGGSVTIRVLFMAEDRTFYENPTLEYGPFVDVREIDLKVRFRIRDGLREFMEARSGQRFQPVLKITNGQTLRVPLGFYVTP